MTRIVLVWVSTDLRDTVDAWVEQEARLPSIAALALRSMSRVAARIELWTPHASLRGVPSGCAECCDASELLSADVVHRALKAGMHVCHVADAIRLLAATRGEGSSIIADLDTVFLRPLPDDDFFLATFNAKATSTLALKNWAPRELHGTTWGGRALSNWPAKFPAKATPFVMLAAEAERQVIDARKVEPFATWMWRLRVIFNENSLGQYAHPPLAAAPWPNWRPGDGCYTLLPKDPGTKFGVALPTRATILSSSFCVQHWFASAYSGAAAVPDDKFWEGVEAESLLGMEAERVAGRDWRMVLSRDAAGSCGPAPAETASNGHKRQRSV